MQNQFKALLNVCFHVFLIIGHLCDHVVPSMVPMTSPEVMEHYALRTGVFRAGSQNSRKGGEFFDVSKFLSCELKLGI